jgi:hypothetical protein
LVAASGSDFLVAPGGDEATPEIATSTPARRGLGRVVHPGALHDHGADATGDPALSNRSGSASAPHSLAWKFLWTETDNDPQAKDLYDRCRAAGQGHPSPLDLVRRVYAGNCASWSHGFRIAA